MIKLVVFWVAILSVYHTDAEYINCNNYNKVYCYLLKDSVVQNHLKSLANSELGIVKWKPKYTICPNLFPFHIFPFYDVINKRLNRDQIDTLLSVSLFSLDSINVNSIKCSKTNKSPCIISFSDERNGFIEVEIYFFISKKNKNNKYYKLKSNRRISVLYEINGNGITNLATRQTTE